MTPSSEKKTLGQPLVDVFLENDLFKNSWETIARNVRKGPEKFERQERRLIATRQLITHDTAIHLMDLEVDSSGNWCEGIMRVDQDFRLAHRMQYDQKPDHVLWVKREEAGVSAAIGGNHLSKATHPYAESLIAEYLNGLADQLTANIARIGSRSRGRVMQLETLAEALRKDYLAPVSSLPNMSTGHSGH